MLFQVNRTELSGPAANPHTWDFGTDYTVSAVDQQHADEIVSEIIISNYPNVNPRRKGLLVVKEIAPRGEIKEIHFRVTPTK